MTSEELKIARKAKGWSQAELGSKLGVQQSIVSRLETGKDSLTAFQDRLTTLFGVVEVKKEEEKKEETPAQVVEEGPAQTIAQSETVTRSKYQHDFKHPKWSRFADDTVVRRNGVEGVVKEHEHAGKARVFVSIGGNAALHLWDEEECEVING